MAAIVLHDHATLGRALRDARRRLQLSQSEVAARSGVRQATISNIEQGVTRATFATVLRVMSAVELELIIKSRRTPPASPWK
ncbi:MAG: helix-turn-helix transcriptional regulator [Deltaproteobacteria bacterium]|nr:helix-turn-helix transcriptional regulator [Deltaproteobacteria bacterium]